MRKRPGRKDSLRFSGPSRNTGCSARVALRWEREGSGSSRLLDSGFRCRIVAWEVGLDVDVRFARVDLRIRPHCSWIEYFECKLSSQSRLRTVRTYIQGLVVNGGLASPSVHLRWCQHSPKSRR